MDDCRRSELVIWCEELDANLDRTTGRIGRFVTFASGTHVVRSSTRCTESGMPSVRPPPAAVRPNVWKDIGLHLRDAAASWLPDDARLDPVWDAVAGGGSAGDDRRRQIRWRSSNRWMTATNVSRSSRENPDWWFGDGDRFPAFERILEALEALVAGASTSRGSALPCARRRTRAGRPDAHDLPERVRGHGGADRGAGRVTKRRPRLLVGTRPIPVRHGRLPADRDVTHPPRIFETADEAFAYDAPRLPRGRWKIVAATSRSTSSAAVRATHGDWSRRRR